MINTFPLVLLRQKEKNIYSTSIFFVATIFNNFGGTTKSISGNLTTGMVLSLTFYIALCESIYTCMLRSHMPGGTKRGHSVNPCLSPTSIFTYLLLNNIHSCIHSFLHSVICRRRQKQVTLWTCNQTSQETVKYFIICDWV